MSAWGGAWGATFAGAWGTLGAVVAPPPAPRYRGPWRLITDQPRTARKREPEKIVWPAPLEPPPRVAPIAAPLQVIVAGESPHRAQLLADLVPVLATPDPILDDEEERAIALLLLG